MACKIATFSRVLTFSAVVLSFRILAAHTSAHADDATGAPSASRSHAQGTEYSNPPTSRWAPAPHRERRLFTLVPRVGAQLGIWGGKLDSVILDWEYNTLSSDLQASGNTGVVLGAEALFRLRCGFRLGAGVLVTPALSYEYESDDGTKKDFKAGTVIRTPGVVEWEVPLSDRISIVPGLIPSILVLMLSDQAKDRGPSLCALRCGDSKKQSIGVAIEGSVGVMWWINRQALRADLRFGYETLKTVSVTSPSSVGETLTGSRMTLLAGFEI